MGSQTCIQPNPGISIGGRVDVQLACPSQQHWLPCWSLSLKLLLSFLAHDIPPLRKKRICRASGVQQWVLLTAFPSHFAVPLEGIASNFLPEAWWYIIWGQPRQLLLPLAHYESCSILQQGMQEKDELEMHLFGQEWTSGSPTRSKNDWGRPSTWSAWTGPSQVITKYYRYNKYQLKTY